MMDKARACQAVFPHIATKGKWYLEIANKDLPPVKSVCTQPVTMRRQLERAFASRSAVAVECCSPGLLEAESIFASL
jgi:hypothetical protein